MSYTGNNCILNSYMAETLTQISSSRTSSFGFMHEKLPKIYYEAQSRYRDTRNIKQSTTYRFWVSILNNVRTQLQLNPKYVHTYSHSVPDNIHKYIQPFRTGQHTYIHTNLIFCCKWVWVNQCNSGVFSLNTGPQKPGEGTVPQQHLKKIQNILKQVWYLLRSKNYPKQSKTFQMF